MELRDEVAEDGPWADGFVDTNLDIGQSTARGGGNVEGDFADEEFDDPVAGNDILAPADQPAANHDRFVGR